MTLPQALFCFWFGGSFSTAYSITVVTKIGGTFKVWEMVVGSIFWPLALFFAWRDHKKMGEAIDRKFEEDFQHFQHVHVNRDVLCHACGTSFDAVMTRISECPACTPLSNEHEH